MSSLSEETDTETIRALLALQRARFRNNGRIGSSSSNRPSGLSFFQGLSECEKREADRHAANILNLTRNSNNDADMDSLCSGDVTSVPRQIEIPETLIRLLEDCDSISNTSELPLAIADLVSICQERNNRLFEAEALMHRLESITETLLLLQQQQYAENANSNTEGETNRTLASTSSFTGSEATTDEIPTETTLSRSLPLRSNHFSALTNETRGRPCQDPPERSVSFPTRYQPDPPSSLSSGNPEVDNSAVVRDVTEKNEVKLIARVLRGEETNPPSPSNQPEVTPDQQLNAAIPHSENAGHTSVVDEPESVVLKTQSAKSNAVQIEQKFETLNNTADDLGIDSPIIQAIIENVLTRLNSSGAATTVASSELSASSAANDSVRVSDQAMKIVVDDARQKLASQGITSESSKEMVSPNDWIIERLAPPSKLGCARKPPDYGNDSDAEIDKHSWIDPPGTSSFATNDDYDAGSESKMPAAYYSKEPSPRDPPEFHEKAPTKAENQGNLPRAAASRINGRSQAEIPLQCTANDVSQTSATPPRKYFRTNGVVKLNPDYKWWRANHVERPATTSKHASDQEHSQEAIEGSPRKSPHDRAFPLVARNRTTLTQNDEKEATEVLLGNRLHDHLIPFFAQNGTALTQEERQYIAKRKGVCVTCGIKTHRISVFKKSPLNNEDVHKGICIKCNPTAVPSKVLQEYEHRHPRINAPVVLRQIAKPVAAMNNTNWVAYRHPKSPPAAQHPYLSTGLLEEDDPQSHRSRRQELAARATAPVVTIRNTKREAYRHPKSAPAAQQPSLSTDLLEEDDPKSPFSRRQESTARATAPGAQRVRRRGFAPDPPSAIPPSICYAPSGPVNSLVEDPADARSTNELLMNNTLRAADVVNYDRDAALIELTQAVCNLQEQIARRDQEIPLAEVVNDAELVPEATTSTSKRSDCIIL